MFFIFFGRTSSCMIFDLIGVYASSILLFLTRLQPKDLLHNQHQLEPATRIQFALGVSMAAVEIQSGNMLRGWAVKYIRQETREEMKLLKWMFI